MEMYGFPTSVANAAVPKPDEDEALEMTKKTSIFKKQECFVVLHKGSIDLNKEIFPR